MDVAGGGARPCWVGRDRWRGEGGAFDANSDRTLKGGGWTGGHASPTPAQKKLKDWRFGLIAFPNLLSLNVSSRINNYLSLRPRSSTWIEYMIDR